VVATNVGGNPEYLKLAHLESFIIELKYYDFFKDLASKIFKALLLPKCKLNNNAIPDWNKVTSKYLNTLSNILRNS
jgi:hypothetical protein